MSRSAAGPRATRPRLAEAPLGALFTPGVRAVFARSLPPELVPLVGRVFALTEAKLAGGVSHGLVVRRLAEGLGLPSADARKLGIVLDALQPGIDLTDDLADLELDRAAGKPHVAVLEAIPIGLRTCLPALMLAAVYAALPALFPGNPQVGAALQRITEILGRMTRGQGRPARTTEHVDDVAGEQGRLLCLPLWLFPGEPARDAAIEAWAFAYGRIWQLRLDAREAPRSPRARTALQDGLRAARAAWPEFAPFAAGGTFDVTRVLGAEG